MTLFIFSEDCTHSAPSKGLQCVSQKYVIACLLHAVLAHVCLAHQRFKSHPDLRSPSFFCLCLSEGEGLRILVSFFVVTCGFHHNTTICVFLSAGFGLLATLVKSLRQSFFQLKLATAHWSRTISARIQKHRINFVTRIHRINILKTCFPSV